MATRLYDIKINDEEFEIDESAGAAITNDFAFTVDIATVSTFEGKQQIILALEALKQYIENDTWPPA